MISIIKYAKYILVAVVVAVSLSSCYVGPGYYDRPGYHHHHPHHGYHHGRAHY